MSSEASDRSRQEDAEFERARELLERTVTFLKRCMEDPRAALESEDPRDLIQGLRSLSAAPPPDPSDDEAPAAPKAIPIRRRRSA